MFVPNLAKNYHCGWWW